MSPDLEEKLFSKYSELFGDRSAMNWGFECGDGWYSLIESICEYLTFEYI